MSPANIVIQVLTWTAFAALIAAFAQGPRFAPYADDEALLKFSVAHLSQRLKPCQKLSAAERQALPPTRRAFEVCERGRAPTAVRLLLENNLLLETRIDPAGLRDDGRSYYLAYFPVPAGVYRLELALRDTAGDGDYNFRRNFELNLAAGDSAILEVGDDEAVLSTYSQERS